MGTAIKHPVPDRVKPLFVRHWQFLTSGHSDAERQSARQRQSARMSKVTNDGTRSGTGIGCFITVPIWQQWASKG